MYIAGVVESINADPRRIIGAQDTFRHSVELSEKLGILETEVKARRSWCEAAISLITQVLACLEHGRRSSRGARVNQDNEDRAEEYGSKALVARNLWTMAKLDWTILRYENQSETDVEAEARRILSLLHEARTELSAAYDIQAVILISRDLAAILASIGRLDQAVSELREGMTATEWGDAPAALLRLSKEAELLRGEATGTIRSELDALLQEISGLQSA